ncbi:helix-turn-helix domain-containing protein [Limnohabitans sp. Rim8]|uniref:helix-turn-helix domain-containing protein n=1 Tax=Limnohabitans sp. Rim8 TaxID=1100718 RepID=UPI002606F6BB|nr:helix-turn-helix domain-containing protein [Limnohabitans sp. Rim8]
MNNDSDNQSGSPMTAGQMLREARMKAGVHVAVLSVNLKVPVRQLEALEANAFDADKGPVFYRGLASSVCRQLNLDPVPVLALLPRPSGQLTALKHIQQPSTLTHAQKSRTFQAKLTSKVFWLGAFLLALTLSFVWMPSPLHWGWLDLSRLPWSQSDARVDVIQDIRVAPTQSTSDRAFSQTRTEPLSPSSVSLPPSGLEPVPALLAVTQEGSAIKNPFVGLTGPTVKSAPWVFKASAESWLELRDAQNVVVWSGLLKAGDTTRIDSPLPVRVVVGRAQSVSVTLRGEAFDLKPHTQVTVARFEVKE